MHRINSQLGAPPNKKGGPLRPPPNGLERDFSHHTPNGSMRQEPNAARGSARALSAPNDPIIVFLSPTHILQITLLVRHANANDREWGLQTW
jgi:hypothetical protein